MNQSSSDENTDDKYCEPEQSGNISVVTLKEHYGESEDKKCPLLWTKEDLSDCSVFVNKKSPGHRQSETTQAEPISVECKEGAEDTYNLKAKYWIGVDWLAKNSLAVRVNPKIDRLDFPKMVSEIANQPAAAQHLGCIYQLKTDLPAIPNDRQKSDYLTPLLILHFLQLVEQLVRRHLKRGYVRVTQRLSASVRGRLLVGASVREHLRHQRIDRVWCSWQEFSLDCPENRILKKALLFSRRSLRRMRMQHTHIEQQLSFCLAPFASVSDQADHRQRRSTTLRRHRLFPEYKEALKLADLILRLLSEDISRSQSPERKTPPYWIDMALLFELYAYATLLQEMIQARDGRSLKYQYGLRLYELGKYSLYVDMLGTGKWWKQQPSGAEVVVFDAKYREEYQKKKHHMKDIIDDIRQISAYARHFYVLDVSKKLQSNGDNGNVADINKTEIVSPPCVILYPSKADNFDWTPEPIGRFYRFYKRAVPIPLIQE